LWYPHLSPRNIRPVSAYRCSIDTTCRQYHYAILEKPSSVWCFLYVVWIKERGVAASIKYGVRVNRSFTLMITTKTDRNLGQGQGESLLRSIGYDKRQLWASCSSGSQRVVAGKELYGMIYLSTAVGLTPGGSSTVHIYTKTIHVTAQMTIEQHK
jgi:hypothetical protein